MPPAYRDSLTHTANDEMCEWRSNYRLFDLDLIPSRSDTSSTARSNACSCVGVADLLEGVPLREARSNELVAEEELPLRVAKSTLELDDCTVVNFPPPYSEQQLSSLCLRFLTKFSFRPLLNDLARAPTHLCVF